jgi:hypothetical protein
MLLLRLWLVCDDGPAPAAGEAKVRPRVRREPRMGFVGVAMESPPEAPLSAELALEQAELVCITRLGEFCINTSRLLARLSAPRFGGAVSGVLQQLSLVLLLERFTGDLAGVKNPDDAAPA